MSSDESGGIIDLTKSIGPDGAETWRYQPPKTPKENWKAAKAAELSRNSLTAEDVTTTDVFITTISETIDNQELTKKIDGWVRQAVQHNIKKPSRYNHDQAVGRPASEKDPEVYNLETKAWETKVQSEIDRVWLDTANMANFLSIYLQIRKNEIGNGIPTSQESNQWILEFGRQRFVRALEDSTYLPIHLLLGNEKAFFESRKSFDKSNRTEQIINQIKNKADWWKNKKEKLSR